jgi:hypothetical protein
MMTKTFSGSSVNAADIIALGAKRDTAHSLKDGDLRDFTRFVLQALTGQVRVFASLDGVNYPAAPIVLSLEPAVDGSDNVTEPQGTFVAATSGTRLHYFFGTYKSLKILQKGATAASVKIFASER